MKFSGKIGWCQKRVRMAQKRIQSQMRPITLGQRRRRGQRTAGERDLIDLTALHRWVFVVVSVFLSFRLCIHLCLCNRDFRKGAQNGALVQGKTLCTQPSWWSTSAITTSWGGSLETTRFRNKYLSSSIVKYTVDNHRDLIRKSLSIVRTPGVHFT